MKTLKFKTNINCSNCLAKVTPKLNEQVGIESWSVDLEDPDRTLTVQTVELEPEAVKKAVLKAGFLANVK